MPRMGIGMPIISETSEAAVLAVEDFVFLNDVSGELTPVDTSSRTNKILQSQTFKTTWTTNNAAIPNDLYTAPDGTLTAQAITASSAGASDVFINQVVATTAGETYTYSVHVKKKNIGFILLLFSDGSTGRTAYFNADTGSTANVSGVLSTSFDKMDDGWRRVGITFQVSVSSSSTFVRAYAVSAAGSTATSAAFQAGTELLYIWGAQLEEDSRTTAYIVTTNAVVNAVTTELNDVSNVWDFDGTDIMLEVDPDSEGAFEEATANLVTNHDFAVDANWTKGTGWSISGGKAIFSGSNFANLEPNNSIIVVGNTYELTLTAEVTNGSFKVQNTGSSDLITESSSGTYSVIWTATSTLLTIARATVGSQNDFTIDNISVKEYAITPLNV